MTDTSDIPITTAHEPEALAVVYETLLVPSFPSSELIARDDFLAAVASGRASVRIAGDPAAPRAMAMTERFEHTSAVLLVYFATRPDQRGRGVGSALLRQILDDLAADESVSVILGEVEHPAHHAASEAHGDPVARLRFYARLGAQILEVPYFQPPVAEDEEPVYAMLLLTMDPPESLTRDGRLLPEAGVAEALGEMMHGVDPERFPVEAVLSATRDPRGIRFFAPERLSEAPVSRPPAAEH